MPDSIFTKIINRELPAKIVYEDDAFIAFEDIHPKAPVHVLLVTKEPYASLEKIPVENTELHAKILKTVRKVAQQLGIVQNYKIAMNVGEGVQAVHHLHVHVMGGWEHLQSPADAEVGI
jgi:histidine triad (HIT) family protein